jgi:hypothetical protein
MTPRNWVNGVSVEGNQAWSALLAWKNAVLDAEGDGVPAPPVPAETLKTLNREMGRLKNLRSV